MRKTPKIQENTESLRHGGREVLRLVSSLPVGDSAMHDHLRSLSEHLLAYAKSTYLQAAVSALEQAAATGTLHQFRPHCYRVCATLTPDRRGWLCTLSATLQGSDGSLLFSHTLTTHWSADGALQRPQGRAKRSIIRRMCARFGRAFAKKSE